MLSNIPWYERVWRFIMHFPIGFCAVWFGIAASIAITLSFIAYEINQCAYKEDKAYRDIVGFCAGAIVAGVIIKWVM